MTYQAGISGSINFLKNLITEKASEAEKKWISTQEKKFKNEVELRSFYFAFSSAPRAINKEPLQLSKTEKDEAENLRKGFRPEHWNLLQLVRVYFLLQLPHKEAEEYKNTIEKLFETADLDEQIGLYSALPLLPYPEVLAKRAVEGIRTNVTDVFDAIALENPFPSDFLTEKEWNQMILKAVFMQRPLYKIYGADARANEDLARMLVDFAHERWAAGRKVTPELWRFVGPYLNEDHFPDLEKVMQGEPLERQAGLLISATSIHPKSREILEENPQLKKQIETGKLNWNLLGKEYHSQLL